MPAVGTVPIRYGVLPCNYPHNYQNIYIYIVLNYPCGQWVPYSMVKCPYG